MPALCKQHWHHPLEIQLPWYLLIFIISPCLLPCLFVIFLIRRHISAILNMSFHSFIYPFNKYLCSMYYVTVILSVGNTAGKILENVIAHHGVYLPFAILDSFPSFSNLLCAPDCINVLLWPLAFRGVWIVGGMSRRFKSVREWSHSIYL